MDDGDMGYGIRVRAGVVSFDSPIATIFVIFGALFVDINCWPRAGSRNTTFRVNPSAFPFLCSESCDTW
jgi:hypothetical protein